MRDTGCEILSRLPTYLVLILLLQNSLRTLQTYLSQSKCQANTTQGLPYLNFLGRFDLLCATLYKRTKRENYSQYKNAVRVHHGMNSSQNCDGLVTSIQHIKASNAIKANTLDCWVFMRQTCFYTSNGKFVKII